MKIYAIGDLHLSGKPPSKPMEIFGEHWADHAAKVAANWHQLIRSDDTVIICGDTSWAMDLQDALTDLNWIAALPGRKIILRGNHDYWWSSLKKMQTATENNFSFLQNNFLPAARLPSAAVVAGSCLHLTILTRTMPLSTAVKDCAWRLHWKLPDKPATAIS
ncbi:MAG: metallophosphoesterase [Phascolarctobacterium faecium]|uniref:metallophosphoesterase n=1 Tax=Phascolarctobacterium faecium TaxID=33025 RepID=UPI003999D6E2